eukprot:5389650-Heterocapsa_arctica.AAC.1
MPSSSGPSSSAPKKVTFQGASGEGKCKKVEWPSSLRIYSHCKTCCWHTSPPSERIETCLHVDCR